MERKPPAAKFFLRVPYEVPRARQEGMVPACAGAGMAGDNEEACRLEEGIIRFLLKTQASFSRILYLLM